MGQNVTGLTGIAAGVALSQDRLYFCFKTNRKCIGRHKVMAMVLGGTQKKGKPSHYVHTDELLHFLIIQIQNVTFYERFNIDEILIYYYAPYARFIVGLSAFGLS